MWLKFVKKVSSPQLATLALNRNPKSRLHCCSPSRQLRMSTIRSPQAFRARRRPPKAPSRERHRQREVSSRAPHHRYRNHSSSMKLLLERMTSRVADTGPNSESLQRQSSRNGSAVSYDSVSTSASLRASDATHVTCSILAKSHGDCSVNEPACKLVSEDYVFGHALRLGNDELRKENPVPPDTSVKRCGLERLLLCQMTQSQEICKQLLCNAVLQIGLRSMAWENPSCKMEWL